MREFTAQLQDNVQVTAPAEDRRIVKRAEMRMQKGLTYYELDIVSLAMNRAVYEEVNVELSGEVRKKLVIKPNHLYCPALNVKNASRKFLRILQQLAEKNT